MLFHTHAVTFSSLIFSIFLLPFYLSIVLFLYKIWGPDLDNKVYYERSQNIDNIVSLSRRWEPGSHPQHHKTGWKNQYKRLICFLIFQLLRVTFPSCSLQTMKGQKLLLLNESWKLMILHDFRSCSSLRNTEYCHRQDKPHDWSQF